MNDEEMQIVARDAQIKELEQRVGELEALVRYWKWQAVGYGAPDFETFEVKQ